MDTKARFSIRPEVILGLVALLTMTLFGIMLYRCVPYMLSERTHLEAPTEPAGHTDAPVPPEELTEEATEDTTEPTIPPEANPYNKRDFQYNDSNYLLCTRQTSYAGVDVSAFQGEIDWDKVASSGIRFAWATGAGVRPGSWWRTSMPRPTWRAPRRRDFRWAPTSSPRP